MLHVFETYAMKIFGFCPERFCAQAHVKVGVGPLHRGIGRGNKTQIRRLCIVGRTATMCGVVDGRELDGREMERKPRLKNTKKTRMKRNICSLD